MKNKKNKTITRPLPRLQATSLQQVRGLGVLIFLKVGIFLFFKSEFLTAHGARHFENQIKTMFKLKVLTRHFIN